MLPTLVAPRVMTQVWVTTVFRAQAEIALDLKNTHLTTLNFKIEGGHFTYNNYMVYYIKHVNFNHKRI